mmetsp:Transcript_63676/g.149557  ORF Transcript_63676/g.149557 Transcript_63676/m.149557 type:complete len:210 (+) Transcript_63676:220-849(+)
MYATVLARSLLYRLSKARIMVRSSSATQLPDMVSLLSYLSIARTSSSCEPPQTWMRMRTAKPMSCSFTRKVQRSVDPLVTWYAQVCSVLAGTDSSSAPWTLMSFHCSSRAAISKVSLADPLQATALTPSVRILWISPYPFSHTVPAPALHACVLSLTASRPCCVFSMTTFPVSLATSRPFCTRSFSAISEALLFAHSTLCCTFSFSATF